MAWHGGESTQIFWQSSGVGMLGVREVMREESQVVLAVRQEGMVVEVTAPWSMRRRRRGAMAASQVLNMLGHMLDFKGGSVRKEPEMQRHTLILPLGPNQM